MEKLRSINLKKYFAIFKYSLKMNLTFIWDYLFSAFSFAAHVIVFNSLWDFILKDGSVFGYNKQEMIWYIIITEFITFSAVIFYKKISEMVLDGTIANLLIKPMNFLIYVVFEQSANFVKIIINAVMAVILGSSFGGAIAISKEAIVMFIVSFILALIISTLIQLIIGLIAFYIEETKSIWFVIQKMQFLLVFVPIEFYGNIMEKILLILPTTHIVYTPATILIKYDFNNCIALLLMQIMTIIALILATCILYKKGVRKINVNGG